MKTFPGGNFTRPHLKYRSDIDGLRAIAVISVMLFHAFPGLLKGGFVGVDIFFVISGFLISSIIFENLERENVSFFDFYQRRIRRIFPALLVVLIFCLIFGWFTLLSGEFSQLGLHIAGGAGFVSNLQFWNEAGYFDNAADTKVLLNLWSLGIEEQFYIFWPLLVWLTWKKRFNLLLVIISVGCLSFACNIYSVRFNSIAAFYSPLSRFWELLLGSLLAWMTLYKNDQIIHAKHKLTFFIRRIYFFGYQFKYCPNSVDSFLSVVGIILIGVGLWKIKSTMHFPGFWALLPTVGTALLLLSGGKAIVNRFLLSNRVLVAIGLISFPLYLWHWPLLTFARILLGEAPNTLVRAILFIATFPLAWATYQFIERPLRFGGAGFTKTVALFLSMFVIGGLGYGIYISNGLVHRDVVKINATSESGADGGLTGIPISECYLVDKNKKSISARCIYDGREDPRYAIIGDSKTGALYPGVMRTSKVDGRWMAIMGGKEGIFIPALMDVAHESRVYLPNSEAFIQFLSTQKSIQTVVLTSATRVLFGLNTDKTLEPLMSNQNYDAVFNGMYKFIDALVKLGKSVVIVVDNPALLDPKDCLARQTSLVYLNKMLPKQNPEGCNITISTYLEHSAQYRKLLNELEKSFKGKVTIFDTTPFMCDVKNNICLPVKNGRLMYSYSDHISDYAGGLIGSALNSSLAKK